MEAAGFCNIQVPAYQTTRYHIPEHSHLCVSARITGMCLALAVLQNGNLLKPLYTNTSLSVSHFIHLYSIIMALPLFNLSRIISAFAITYKCTKIFFLKLDIALADSELSDTLPKRTKICLVIYMQQMLVSGK
jgi:hypothetical protein